MARIYVYSPSGAVRDRMAFRRGIRRLQALGHDVEVDQDALTRWQRFAGDDDVRLAAMRRAASSGADVAMITRGGYGLSRLLPQLPWPEIAQAAEAGTRLVGFSDFTILQLGLLARGGPITWAGPALCESFGAAAQSDDRETEPVDEIMLACFEDMVSGAGEGTGWRLSAADMRALGDQSGHMVEKAVLWGGNLSMVNSLLGTPWWPDVHGGVLFLEDVGEHPYRVERLLTQLLHAGVLEQQRAILLGQFTEYQTTTHDQGYSLARVVEWLRRQLATPVFTGLPFGHTPTKVLLPVGASVDIVVEGREILVLWGHLHS